MTDVVLSQKEADKLIQLTKVFLKKYSKVLFDGCSDTIRMKSIDGKHKFRLDYKYQIGNTHLNFSDEKTQINLVRLNLNNSFHKNANGEKVRGNRVNIYCVDEAIASGQDLDICGLISYHITMFLLILVIFLDALEQILKYTHVKDYQDNLNLKVEQTSLNI